MLDRIKAWFKHVATVLWARIVGLGGIFAALEAMGGLFEAARNQGEYSVPPRSQIRALLHHRDCARAELARRRTLSKGADRCGRGWQVS